MHSGTKGTSSTRARELICVLVFFSLLIPLPLLAQAPPNPNDTRMRVYVFPVSNSPDVSKITVLKMDEFFNAILSVNDRLHLLKEEDLIVLVQPEKPLVAENKALAKADEELWKGKEALQRGKFKKAAKILKRAVAGYEKNYKDLMDYDKIVDGNLHRAIALFRQGYEDNAEELLADVIRMRPDISIDKKKHKPEFMQMLERVRTREEGFVSGDVMITSDPSGASVFVDGIKRGATPMTLRGILRGKHYVQLRAEAFLSYATVLVAPEKGKTFSVEGKLPRDEAAELAEVEGEFISPDSLIPYAESGNFGLNFKRAARYFCGKAQVNYLLYTYISPSDGGYRLSVFLYDAQKEEIVALKPTDFDHELTNLQVNMLEAEQVLLRAMAAFPMSRVVRDPPPEVYREGQSKAIAGVTSEGAASSSAVTVSALPTVQAPPPTPAPVVSVPAQPQGSPQSTPGIQSVFGDYPSAFGDYPTAAGASAAGGYPGVSGSSMSSGDPWYEEWWVWTLVGVGAAGIGVGTWLIVDSAGSSEAAATNSFTGTVRLP